MTRITNAEQVLMLLRSHLERAQRSRRGTATAAARKEARPSALQRAQQVASDGLPETEIGRALIAAMLEDEFGGGVANDTKFRQVVDEVIEIIKRDDASGRLLQRAVAQLASPDSG